MTLRNNANGASWLRLDPERTAGAGLLTLSGASGLLRAITANNAVNATSGTITYGGAALYLARGIGEWSAGPRTFGIWASCSTMPLQPGALLPGGGLTTYRSPGSGRIGAINGVILTDLGLVARPTPIGGRARRGRVGYDVKRRCQRRQHPALWSMAARRRPPSRANGGHPFARQCQWAAGY